MGVCVMPILYGIVRGVLVDDDCHVCLSLYFMEQLSLKLLVILQ